MTTPPNVNVGHDYFFGLPLELRDMIYELVYGEERTLKIRFRSTWRRAEKIRQKNDREDFVPKPYPRSFFSHLLVSKQFFLEAVKFWLRATTFSIFGHTSLVGMAKEGNPVEQFLLQHVRSLRIDWATYLSAAFFGPFTGLRHISIALSSNILDHKEKQPRHDSYTDAELATMPSLKGLFELRSMQSINAKWESCPTVTKAAQKVRVIGVMAQTQRVLRDITYQPRERPIDNTDSIIPTFDGALECLVSRSSPQPILAVAEKEVPAAIEPLTDAEIPCDLNAFVQLFHARPEALFGWTKMALEERKEWDKSLSELS